MEDQLSTSINKLKKCNIDSLIKNIETNIENIPITKDYIPLKSDSLYKQSNYENLEKIKPSLLQKEEPKLEEKIVKFHIGKLKEYIIIMLLFILLANPKIDNYLGKYIKIFDNINSNILSLVLKSFIFVLLIFIFKLML